MAKVHKVKLFNCENISSPIDSQRWSSACSWWSSWRWGRHHYLGFCGRHLEVLLVRFYFIVWMIIMTWKFTDSYHGVLFVGLWLERHPGVEPLDTLWLCQPLLSPPKLPFALQQLLGQSGNLEQHIQRFSWYMAAPVIYWQNTNKLPRNTLLDNTSVFSCIFSCLIFTTCWIFWEWFWWKRGIYKDIFQIISFIFIPDLVSDFHA